MTEFLKGKVLPIDWAINGAIVGITVALAAAFVFAVILPTRASIQETEDSTATVALDIKKAERLSAEHEALEAESKGVQDLVRIFEERLPAEEEISALVETCEQLASEVGCTVKLAGLPRISDQHKDTIPYQVRAGGNFHQIATFINRLEKYKRFLKVSDLKIGPQQEGISEAQFTLSTYRFIESPETEAAAGGVKK